MSKVVRIYEGYFNNAKSDNNDDIVSDIESVDSLKLNRLFDNCIELEMNLEPSLVHKMFDLNEPEAYKQFTRDVYTIQKRLKKMEDGFSFIDEVSDDFIITNAIVDYDTADVPVKVGDITVMTDKLDRVIMASIYVKFWINCSFKRVKDVERLNKYLTKMVEKNTSFWNTSYFIDDKDHEHEYSFDTDDDYHYFCNDIRHLCSKLYGRDIESELLDVYSGGNAVWLLNSQSINTAHNYVMHINRPVNKNIIAGSVVCYDISEYHVDSVQVCGKLNKPVWLDTELREYIFANEYAITYDISFGKADVFIVSDGYFYDGSMKQIVSLHTKCENCYIKSNSDEAGFRAILEMVRTAGMTEDEIFKLFEHISRKSVAKTYFGDYCKNPHKYD